jgi:hypothetical protein
MKSSLDESECSKIIGKENDLVTCEMIYALQDELLKSGKETITSWNKIHDNHDISASTYDRLMYETMDAFYEKATEIARNIKNLMNR